MKRVKYKKSYGIALCRYNKDKNWQNEILMIKKRYTYHYCSFVLGKYNKHNTKYIQYLFNNMTFHEKVDILSLKFSNMWYRLWLFDPEKNYDIGATYNKETNFNEMQLNYYMSKKYKFESIFLNDGGKRLKRMINNSENSVTPWEVPKGNKNQTNETDLDCAKREFEEETGINSNQYIILWNVNPIIVSHEDENTIYKSIYYLAYLKKDSNWIPKIKFNTSDQLNEIEQVRWISFNEIQFLNLCEKYKNRLKNNYKNIIYHFKNKVKSQYYL